RRTQGPRRAGGPGRGRVPAADLHQAGAGPAHLLLRTYRAARFGRVRQGQLQGTVRGDRARAAAPGQPVSPIINLGSWSPHDRRGKAYLGSSSARTLGGGGERVVAS